MYRTIETGIWDDPVVIPLTREEKLTFVYLFTNRLGHVSGIYYIPDIVIQKHLASNGTPLLDRVLDRVWDTLSRVGLAWRDPKIEVVFVRSMLRRQGPGEKNRRAAAKHIQTLHETPLIQMFLKEYPEVKHFLPSEFLHRVSPRVSDRVSEVGVQEQEQEQEQERKENASHSLKESSAPPSEARAPTFGPRDLVVLWNEHAQKLRLAQVKDLTEPRRAKAKLRLQNRPDRKYWASVFKNLPEARFALGHGPSGWKLDFDKLVSNDTVAVKILEGGYDNVGLDFSGGSKTPGGLATQERVDWDQERERDEERKRRRDAES